MSPSQARKPKPNDRAVETETLVEIPAGGELSMGETGLMLVTKFGLLRSLESCYKSLVSH